jgi:uncharacterized RDD family membrane protein YckC
VRLVTASPAGAGAGEAALLPLPEPVVTGDGVLLDLRPASVLTRGLALLLDLLVLALVGLGAGLLLARAGGGLDSTGARAVGLLAAVGVLVVLPATWEALSRGRSPGKAAAGLRVVRDDGGPVRARHAAVRALVGFGELFLTSGAVAVVCSLAHPRGKRIGDLLAGTHVVRERTTAPPAAPLVMPEELRAWASSVDIGPLPDELTTAARRAVGQADGMLPEARLRVLTDLAGLVGERLAPPAPPGTAPERLLAAVLHERRTRDLARLRARRERRDALAEESRRLQGL